MVGMDPRPNLIIALLAGILFYLGFAMPGWLERVLIRFELNPRLLEQNLWLVAYISEYYNKMAPVSPTRLEHTLKGFCKFLGIKKSQIDLIVKASYLINVGKLYSSAVPCVPRPSADGEELHQLSFSANEVVDAEKRRSINVGLSVHIAKEILQFSKIADILRHVCERWDGLGYPVHFVHRRLALRWAYGTDELKGEEIPFESRILAIVDFFVRSSNENGDNDARRGRLPLEADSTALILLKDEASKKLAPNLVEKFDVFCKRQQPPFPPRTADVID